MSDSEQVKHLKECNGVSPRFWFNWLYWFPKVYTNLRRLDNTTNVFTVTWLCVTQYLHHNSLIRSTKGTCDR